MKCFLRVLSLRDSREKNPSAESYFSRWRFEAIRRYFRQHENELCMIPVSKAQFLLHRKLLSWYCGWWQAVLRVNQFHASVSKIYHAKEHALLAKFNLKMVQYTWKSTVKAIIPNIAKTKETIG